MARYLSSILILICSIAAAGPVSQPFSVQINPRYIIPSDEAAERGSVSPDGERLAVWVSVGERGYIWCDGRCSRQWDAALLPKFSPDSRHFAYIGLESTGEDNYRSYVVYDTMVLGPFTYLPFDKYGTDELVFSPDSRHFAFRAWAGKDANLYLDGQKIGTYPGFVGPPPQFSPNSERLACHVADSLHGQLILDGTPGPQYVVTTDLCGFSDDSRLFCYSGVDERGSRFAIIDSTMFGPFYRIPLATFRPRSQELWLVASRGVSTLETLYVDAKPRAAYQRVLEVAFDDHGRRSAYIAEDSADQYVIVIDTNQYQSNDRPHHVLFGPEGYHVSHLTSFQADSGGSFENLFIDNRIYGPFAEFSPITYSPDGLRYLFIAIDSLRSYQVFTESTSFGPFDSAAVVGWSPDSRHFAFTVSDSSTSTMYIDGRPERNYLHVMRQVWFDTLNASSAYIADPETKGVALVVNDTPLVPLDFYYGSAEGFDSTAALRGYGQLGDTIVQYVVRRSR